MVRLNYKLAFCFVLLLVATACNKDDDGPSFDYIVEFEKVSTISSATVRSAIIFSQLDIPVASLQYDVDVYKISYSTQYKGEEIVASGVVALPVMEKAKGTLSFQHGTIAADDQAPSNNVTTNDLLVYATVSSAGLMVSIPDYIGFGASVDIMHPYYDESLTASAIVDQLYAAKELAAATGLDLPEDLYLAGYSQGGYATMATHKYYEEQDIEGFSLKVSFPAAGGYDVKGVRDYFFEQETYEEPFFIAYVAESYRVTYDWTSPLSTYFKEPYASRIPDLFGGDLSGSEINLQLTTEIADLVAEDYLENTNDAKFDEINEAFESNSLTDWTPGIDMIMYHGSADITVPYEISVEVFSHFNSSKVSFIEIVEGTHSTSFIPYLEDMSQRLNDYLN
ncbi:MAG: hypothetical protein KI791_06770 [Cyclobacteriaceae bacterium]|nr:hypothetical protein [Cyclobacteriaceae bacterium SS2]